MVGIGFGVRIKPGKMPSVPTYVQAAYFPEQSRCVPRADVRSDPSYVRIYMCEVNSWMECFNAPKNKTLGLTQHALRGSH